MFWPIPNLMALERGILSSILSKARNIDTCQLKHKSKNSSGRFYIALLSQVHTIHRSQHSIRASLVGTHQYAQFVGLDSRCTFAPAVLAYLWKAKLDSIAYLFTCIFYLNIWRKLKNWLVSLLTIGCFSFWVSQNGCFQNCSRKCPQ